MIHHPQSPQVGSEADKASLLDFEDGLDRAKDFASAPLAPFNPYSNKEEVLAAKVRETLRAIEAALETVGEVRSGVRDLEGASVGRDHAPHMG